MSRYFFAIYPDKFTRNNIVQCERRLNLSGRKIKISNLHLTLLFLGQLNVNQLQQLIHQSKHISCPQFEFILNHTGCFKNKIIWLGLSQIPLELAKLNQQLTKIASQIGLKIQARQYLPHVTLAKNSTVKHQKQEITPITWQVNSFVLFESIDTQEGVHYHAVEWFS